jgi:riboflavin synthase
MFTGLIQEIGTLRRITRRAEEAELTVGCAFEHLVLGESVAVMGACLTVTRFSVGEMTAFASVETLEKTGLGEMASGAKVNLEPALKLGDPLGGHLVSGHVDERVRLISRASAGGAERFTIALPAGRLAKQVAEKGSVALDGVSLTVNDVRAESFEVMIIPHTLQATTLGALRPGDRMNIETDVLAKYIARQLDAAGEKRDIDMALLQGAGFVR